MIEVLCFNAESFNYNNGLKTAYALWVNLPDGRVGKIVSWNKPYKANDKIKLGFKLDRYCNIQLTIID